MLKKLLLVLPLLSLIGCAGYVENTPPAVDVSAITPRTQLIPVVLDVKVITNAKENSAEQQKAYDDVKNVILNSRVFSLANDPSAAKLKINIDEEFSTSGAFIKGFLTGFTFGIIRTTSEDNLHMSATLEQPGRASAMKNYDQNIYVSIGLVGLSPDNSTKVDMTAGFDEAVKKLTTIYLRDVSQGAI